MSRCIWSALKVEDAGDGWYRLKTMFRGEGECLESNQAPNFSHGTYSGGSFMDKCQNVSGQLWKFEKVEAQAPAPATPACDLAF